MWHIISNWYYGMSYRKGKKDVNAKRTTYFLKQGKIRNRPAYNKINSLFCRINGHGCKTNRFNGHVLN